MEEYIVCQICKKQLRELNYHLPKMHALTVKQYNDIYPNSPIISELSSYKKSQKIKSIIKEKDIWGYNSWSEQTKIQRNKKLSEYHELEKLTNNEYYMKIRNETTKKMRDKKGINFKHTEHTKCLIGSKLKGIKRSPLSDETKDKIRKTKINIKRGPHTKETIEKMKESWKIRKQDKIKYSKYIEQLKYITRKNAKNGTRNLINFVKYTNTSLEIKMKNFLEINSLKYIHQFEMNTEKTIWLIDFYIPSLNLMLEVDGEYWHSKSLEQINKDILKEKYAIKQGYNFLRISDKDWKPNLIFSSSDIQINHNNKLINNRKKLFF